MALTFDLAEIIAREGRYPTGRGYSLPRLAEGHE